MKSATLIKLLQKMAGSWSAYAAVIISSRTRILLI